MLNKRGDFAAAVLNGNVVAAGGLCKKLSCQVDLLSSLFLFTANEGKPLSEVEVYDATANAWRPLTPMAHPHCSCAFTVYNNKLHIVGGLSTGGATNIVDVLSHQ
jgi:N-acetylneuraminic acid mutarotase